MAHRNSALVAAIVCAGLVSAIVFAGLTAYATAERSTVTSNMRSGPVPQTSTVRTVHMHGDETAMPQTDGAAQATDRTYSRPVFNYGPGSFRGGNDELLW